MKNTENETPFGRRGRHGRGGGHAIHGLGGHGGRGHSMGGPQGRRRKQFDGEALRTMVLSLIGEGNAHGYELIRTFSDRSGGAYAPSPGMIYPLLTLLDELGLVEDKGEGSRRSFALTEAGQAEVTAQAEEVVRLFQRLDALAAAAARVDPTPVRRAMQNLKMALMDRLGRDDATPETVFAAVEKIDAVAREIERL